MSGGYFNYYQTMIKDIADELQQLIQNNGTPDRFGDTFNFSQSTLDKFRLAEQTCTKAAQMVRRVDWLLSGDDGEETFHQRWKKEKLPEPDRRLGIKDNNYSHFGLKKEDQPESGPIPNSDSAEVDGYHFGDRLLEGVFFIITIKDGKLTAKVRKDAEEYFENLNKEKWLDAAINYAASNDIFGKDEVRLIMDDGRYNTD